MTPSKAVTPELEAPPPSPETWTPELVPPARPERADVAPAERGAVPEGPHDIECPEFWVARPELAHLRDFARSRRASPWAVLGCALVRVIAHVEPFVVLPPFIGGDASLNLFLGLVGPSGGGKGAAESAARDALGFDTSLTEAGVGSGEGIAHTYQRYVPGKRGENGTIEQHTSRALFRAPEVDTLAALKGRQGSTLLPKLRDAWLGDSLGFAYADLTRRLDLRAHTYRMCLIVGIQPARAGVLLEDADGGTPQRFLWLPTRDPNVPAVRPPTPDRLRWKHPGLGAVDPWTNRYRLPVCSAAADAIDKAAIDRHHGKVEALDGHALMSRLKTAAALAFLNGRPEVTDDDWSLSGTVLAVSDATRTGIIRSLTDHARAQTAARGRAEGERAVVAEQVRSDAAAQRVSRGILRKLSAAAWTPRNDLRRLLASRDRDHFDDALDRLTTAGLIEVALTEHNGSQGTQYRLAKGTS